MIRKISNTKTANDLWCKLESLYDNILAPNLAYFNSSLYAFRFDVAKSINDYLDVFLKITQLLDGTEHCVDEVSHVIILMNVLHDSYHVVNDAFQ